MVRRITIAAVVVALASAGSRVIRHVVVRGPSMLPTLAPGDRLLFVRRAGRLRVGHLVLVVDPRDQRRELCKRVWDVAADGVDVRGDNPAASTDSRTFGRLPTDGVTAYRVWRYAPAERRGRVNGSRARAVPRRSRRRAPR